MVDERSLGPLSVEGCLDEIEPHGVSGWAWIPQRPEEIADVEFVGPSGDIVARGQASGFRGDLEAAGKRGGRCAFEIALPLASLGPFELRARSPSGEGEPLVFAHAVAGLSPEPSSSSFMLGASAGVFGYLDEANHLEISGWCHAGAAFSEPVALELVEAGQVLATIKADRWRQDLEDLRQGDGRCGFKFAPPAMLYDGAEHQLDLRLPGGGSLTAQPMTIAFPAVAPVLTEQSKPVRPAPGGAPVLSIIVNFYNMEREAARTLLSLSRKYQEGVEDIPYEVLCIDNGSNPPLSEAFVASFGPEFRLIRPAVVRPSPCAALNEAAAMARGRWLALMIDGAHLLSPGALREAYRSLNAEPGAIVALRQWFIGGDQRWLSSVGYSRELEDLLFARINWPDQGYRIFNIASPMFESPNSWFDGLSESNCLFVPSDLYRQIGGFDEAFEIPGAGFANLDLFRRAAAAAVAVVCLVGEASFHQYHGGVTTNIDDAEKDRRVRAYAAQYEQVRGEEFVNLAPEKIRLAGSIQISSALAVRQRNYCPAQLGVTDRVRPRTDALQFDEDAQKYLQTTYIETGRHLDTRWAGLAVGVAPSDLTDIQEAIWRVRPEFVVMKDARPGLVRFVASILPSLGLDDTQILVPSNSHETGDLPVNVKRIAGDPNTERVLDQVWEQIGAAEHVLVLYQPDADQTFPVESLNIYARFVSFDSYLIVLSAALGQPWLGYSQSRLYRAIVRFVEAHPGFVVDRTMNRHFITTCPSGFLRRVLDPVRVGEYDLALDDLSGL